MKTPCSSQAPDLTRTVSVTLQICVRSRSASTTACLASSATMEPSGLHTTYLTLTPVISATWRRLCSSKRQMRSSGLRTSTRPGVAAGKSMSALA